MLPDGVEFEEYSASSEYKQILRVIAALANQDERIVEQFQVRLLETDKPEKDKTKVVDFIGYQFVIDPEQLRQQIEVSISRFVGSRNFRIFEEARRYVQSLNLKGKSDHQSWVASGKKPHEIPAQPDRFYKNQGWVSWGDYLGTGNVAFKNLQFRNYDDASNFVHQLKIQSSLEYVKWAKTSERPDDIPASPSEYYKNKGWVNWGHWLGTNKLSYQERQYLPYEEAKKIVQAQNFKLRDDYKDWIRSEDGPENIPNAPNWVYKNKGWKNWTEYLGSNSKNEKNRDFKSYEEAKFTVHRLGLKNQRAYNDWAKSQKRPPDIPANPQAYYLNSGWSSWPDWLGSDKRNEKKREYKSFLDAKNFVQALKFEDLKAYRKWAKSEHRPVDIPSSPDKIYKDRGWKNWSDYLGSDPKKARSREYRSFNEAREFVRQLKFKRKDDYAEWSKSTNRPLDIPSRPGIYYKDKGWISWGDWLGTMITANQNRQFRRFEDAKVFVQSLGMQSQLDYRNWSKSIDRPDDIPSDPARVYKNSGWVSWGDWLGTRTTASQKKEFLSFSDARKIVHSMNLKSIIKYKDWANSEECPHGIPASPNHIYKSNGWVDWHDWLGKKHWEEIFLSYAEAKVFVRRLKLNSLTEYKTWARSILRPTNIPKSPQQFYKNKGWIDWYDWLGKPRPDEALNSSS